MQPEPQNAKILEKYAQMCARCNRKVVKTGGCDYFYRTYTYLIVLDISNANVNVGPICPYDSSLAYYRDTWSDDNSAQKSTCVHWRPSPNKTETWT